MQRARLELARTYKQLGDCSGNRTFYKRAIRDYKAILRDGHTESLSHMMATFDDREAAVNTEHYMELDARYAH